MPIPLGVLAVAGAGATGGADFVRLATTVLTSDTRTVTFSGLDSYSNYKHLQIRMVARSASANATTLRIRANGDTGTNYADHALRGTGSAVQGQNRTSQAQIDFQISWVQRSDFTSNVFGAAVLDIQDFSSTSKFTTFRLLAGAGNVANSGQIGLGSGLWSNTAALTSIDLYHGSFENWLSGSRFSLYGIR